MTNTENCSTCGTELTQQNWSASWRKLGRTQCTACSKVNNDKSNPLSMYVNGKYISRSHPLHKPGRYKSFEAAAFSSLEKYESSTQGQVYVITNPNFPEWVKVGMAVDSEDRLNGYQTSSPFRDYALVATWDVTDRRSAESEAHQKMQKLYERRSEWFKCTPEQAREIVTEAAGNYQ